MPLSQGAIRQVEKLLRATRFSAFAAAMVVCSAVVFSIAQVASAQDHPDAPSATQRSQTKSRNTPVSLVTTLNRKSIFFPDIATTEGPLTTGGKFKLFVDDSASLSSLAGSALSAGIGQADDYPHGYGQGGEGYGKRFGANMARTASSNFFGTFILASMLHQDPRFFPQRDPTFGGSIKYSISRVFITRRDDGNEAANWSGLLGPLLSEGLANAYWPEEDRTAGQTLRRYGVDLATTAGFNMFRNYWPVLLKKVRH